MKTMKTATIIVIAVVILLWVGLARAGEVFDIQNAARTGNVEKVKTLLVGHPDLVNVKDRVGLTPLHYAAWYGHKEVVEVLLANKADVNAKNIYGYTPLHHAVMTGHREAIEVLLANKADVSVKDNHGDTPLHRAAMMGHKEVIEILLANKADVNAKNIYGYTPLHHAANKEVAEVLLANKADVNAKDKFGWTPLHGAAASGNKEMVELLLVNKADVNAKDDFGYTPLHHAADKEVAEILLANKADVNAKDNNGDTPLDREANKTHNKEVVEVLLANKADVNAKKDTYKTYRGTIFEFQYPSRLSLYTQGKSVVLTHSVACHHPDFNDWGRGEGPMLDNLTDFEVSFRMYNSDLKYAARDNEPYSFVKEFFQDNTLKTSPGFIDKFSAGSLHGYRVTSGVEGSGHFTYYFPISANRTLFVSRSFIPEFNSINRDYKEYLKLPSIIPPNQEEQYFLEILLSFKARL